jgi:hypothetical protein
MKPRGAILTVGLEVMTFTGSLVRLEDLTREIACLLPEYLPRVSTGAAAPTEGRSCWIEAWKRLLDVCGRALLRNESGYPAPALAGQLTVYWKRGDGILSAFFSGWGDRQELEERFIELEIIKAPQKAILYSCTKWRRAGATGGSSPALSSSHRGRTPFDFESVRKRTEPGGALDCDPRQRGASPLGHRVGKTSRRVAVPLGRPARSRKHGQLTELSLSRHQSLCRDQSY